jgi:hypothetical protein
LVDEVHVSDTEQGFMEIKRSVERLMEQGYKDIDVRTGRDAEGNLTVSVTPREGGGEEK